MQSNSSDEVSLDINKMLQSLRESTERLKPLSGDYCISIVPPNLRELSKEMYTPQVISIGPLHHGKEELKAMEEHKQRYQCAFLHRIHASMEEYLEDLKKLEIRLRQSYVQINGYTREKFMEIMGVDGAFLMEYMLRFYCGGCETNDGIIFGRQRLTTNVCYDTLLIENQLPFFYLEYLFGLFQKSQVDDGAFSLKFIVQYYLACVSPQKGLNDGAIIDEETQVEHLLHFLIICLQGPERKMTERRECNIPTLVAPTFMELHQAGVKFKPSSSNSISSINFSNGILEIPMLILAHQSEMFFRNMQAFEECHNSRNYISDYIWIMDKLINNEHDVKVLVQSDIIENWLEDDRAAATVFNNLGKGNQLNSDFSYSHIIVDLNAYCKIRRHRWKATLKQKYFNSPWTIISVIAAAFLLLLTIIQTICSILEVV